jgi:hypothetical protein
VSQTNQTAATLRSEETLNSPFTAGPWEAPTNGRDGAVYAPNAPKGTLWRICDRIRGLSDEEMEANARLIAASPALLTLVLKARKVLEPLADCDPDVREWLSGFHRVTQDIEGLDCSRRYRVYELADDGSRMEEAFDFDAFDIPEALRLYNAKCTAGGYKPAPRVDVVECQR